MNLKIWDYVCIGKGDLGGGQNIVTDMVRALESHRIISVSLYFDCFAFAKMIKEDNLGDTNVDALQSRQSPLTERWCRGRKWQVFLEERIRNKEKKNGKWIRHKEEKK